MLETAKPALPETNEVPDANPNMPHVTGTESMPVFASTKAAPPRA